MSYQPQASFSAVFAALLSAAVFIGASIVPAVSNASALVI